jgi:hypothetical protein
MPTIPTFPQYLFVSEVSDILRIKVKTLYKLGNKIPGYKKIGGTVLYDADELYKGW